MNPSVSQFRYNGRFSRSITIILGLVQGGELVTVRATEMVKGTLNEHSTHGPIAQHSTRNQPN